VNVVARPVLLLVRGLGIGGCERDLTKIALRLDRARFLPHVGCFDSAGVRAEELCAAGVPIVRFPVQSLIGFSGARESFALGRYLRRHKIGLIHAFDAPTAVFAAPVALTLRLPLIASNLWFRNKIQRRYQYALRAVDRLARALVVNSEAVRRHLIEDENAPRERIHLCHNGVETSVFYPGEAARPAAVRDATLVIGSVCALRPEKRLDRLLHAFANVRARTPGMKLLIVGSGETLNDLEKQRARLGLEDSCVFEPAQKDVAAWLRAIDIFVTPSDTESFPNALLEAMACGCAVIGSRVGGIPELIEDGQSGLLFDRENPDALTLALATLIQHPSRRRELGAAAAARARDRFSMEQAVSRTQAVYDKVCGIA
jgi:glycosyltransferase involved in cell wall biosynthesis